MPYLNVEQGNKEEVEEIEKVEVPDIMGKTLSEAEKIIKEKGLEFVMQNSSKEENIDKEKVIIKNQTPSAGIILNKGNKIYIEI